MYLKKIHVENFRCFERMEMELDPKFNMIIGVNGTGKTAVLEAVRIAIGSLFLKVDKYNGKISSPGITANDVRLSNLEKIYPVKIQTDAVVDDKRDITWERSLETHGGKTIREKAKDIEMYSGMIMTRIRTNEKESNNPLICYFSTERYKKDLNDFKVQPQGSRLTGYFNSLDRLTNNKLFVEVYKTETLSALQHNTKSLLIKSVNSAVASCVDDCETMMFDVKLNELIIKQKSTNDFMFYKSLSDGVRSTLAMVMEIATRCYLLNPHLKENAALETPGIVLIDEIDLHLHPAWQKKVIGDLQKAFPKMQFIVTTHAPLVIGSLKEGKIFSISESKAYEFPLQFGNDANSIINEMGTAEMDKEIRDSLNEYFLLIEAGHGKEDKAVGLRASLEKLLGKEHTEIQRADMLLNFF